MDVSKPFSTPQRTRPALAKSANSDPTKVMKTVEDPARRSSQSIGGNVDSPSYLNAAQTKLETSTKPLTFNVAAGPPTTNSELTKSDSPKHIKTRPLFSHTGPTIFDRLKNNGTNPLFGGTDPYHRNPIPLGFNIPAENRTNPGLSSDNPRVLETPPVREDTPEVGAYSFGKRFDIDGEKKKVQPQDKILRGATKPSKAKFIFDYDKAVEDLRKREESPASTPERSTSKTVPASPLVNAGNPTTPISTANRESPVRRSPAAFPINPETSGPSPPPPKDPLNMENMSAAVEDLSSQENASPVPRTPLSHAKLGSRVASPQSRDTDSSSDSDSDAYVRRQPSATVRCIKKILQRDLSGYIYVLKAPIFFSKFGPAVNRNNEVWVKIGIAEEFDTRLKSLKSKCGISDITEVCAEPMRLDVCKKIEKLCHAQLHNFRRIMDCNKNSESKCRTKAHKEWFAVAPEVARRTVLMWKTFFDHGPYDQGGYLDHFCKASLSKIPNHLDFEADDGEENQEEMLHNNLRAWIGKTAAEKVRR